MRCHDIGLSDVITQFASAIKLPSHHARTLDAIRDCRTSALGGHIDCCDSCGHLKMSYNSCRNRHCPTCQGLNKEMWIIQQEDQLLPVAHFHVVFTIPHDLNELCMYLPSQIYGLLFKAAWHTLKTLSTDKRWLGAKGAATMLLHTWGQNLSLHPHVHCIVPNGGLTKEGKWQYPKRGNGNFLYPVKAMQKVYKGYFMAHLKTMLAEEHRALPKDFPQGEAYKKWKDILYSKDWVVYTKKPFSGVKSVIEYLGRYSHKVAITNQRIKRIEGDKVSFSYKDYRIGGRQQPMELQGEEFLRRFCHHILPLGFRKGRHYGFIANATKAKSIKTARAALQVKNKELLSRAARKEMAKKRLWGNLSDLCPWCKKGHLQTIEILPPTRAPPKRIVRKEAYQ